MDTTEMIPVECVRNLAEEVQELYEAIAARANHYFVARGSINGYHVDDWLRAERDLVVKPHYKLSCAKYSVVVEMVLPVRRTPGLRIRLAPAGMLIMTQPNSDGQRIFRIVGFPESIDAMFVSAEMTGNRLRVTAETANRPQNTHTSSAAAHSC